MSCHQIRLFNCLWIQMEPLWDLREIHKRKEGSVICWLDYKIWKNNLWCKGSCCTSSSLCDPGTHLDAAPEYLSLSFTATLRPGPSAPQQWSLLSLDTAVEKAGMLRGKQEEHLLITPLSLAQVPSKRFRVRPLCSCLPLKTEVNPQSQVQIIAVLKLWLGSGTQICYTNYLFQFNLWL